MKINPDVIMYKIRFMQHGAREDLDGGKFCGVCYIEEKAGSFTLLGVHSSNKEINGMKIDIIRPGGYAYRLACRIPLFTAR